eukprot:3817127-Prymnesium_polylepis.1
MSKDGRCASRTDARPRQDAMVLGRLVRRPRSKSADNADIQEKQRGELTWARPELAPAVIEH